MPARWATGRSLGVSLAATAVLLLLLAHPDRVDAVARLQIAFTALKNAGLVATLAAALVAWAVGAVRR